MSLLKPGHQCQSLLSSTFIELSYNKNDSSQAYYLQAFFYEDFITHPAGLFPPPPTSISIMELPRHRPGHGQGQLEEHLKHRKPGEVPGSVL